MTVFPAQSDAASLGLLERAENGTWLTFEEGLHIYKRAASADLRAAAGRRMAGLWGGKGQPRTYMMYHLLNYSNVCGENCSFCNYWAPAGGAKAWTHNFEDVRPVLEAYWNYGGRVVLFQGGNNYEIGSFSYYTDFLDAMRQRFPDMLVFGCSPTEIHFWSGKYGLPVPKIIAELKAAGLRAIAGAGGEIAHQPIRDLMFKNKVRFGDWLDIMDEAAAQGLSASASMMFGTYDGLDDRFDAEYCRLEHLHLLRERQARTAHYRAFVAWPYQPNKGRIRRKPVPHEEYVRLMSVARLYLRNFPNLQSSYLSLTREQFGASLDYAVNCAGGILYTPELVTGAVGANPNDLSRAQIIEWIAAAGYRPEERDYYGRLLVDPYTGRTPLSNLSLPKETAAAWGAPKEYAV